MGAIKNVGSSGGGWFFQGKLKHLKRVARIYKNTLKIKLVKNSMRVNKLEAAYHMFRFCSALSSRSEVASQAMKWFVHALQKQFPA